MEAYDRAKKNLAFWTDSDNRQQLVLDDLEEVTNGKCAPNSC